MDINRYQCFGGGEDDPQIVLDASYLVEREQYIMQSVERSHSFRSFVSRLSGYALVGSVLIKAGVYNLGTIAAAFPRPGMGAVQSRPSNSVETFENAHIVANSLVVAAGTAALAGAVACFLEKRDLHKKVQSYRDETDNMIVHRLQDPSIERPIIDPVLEDYSWVDSVATGDRIEN